MFHVAAERCLNNMTMPSIIIASTYDWLVFAHVLAAALWIGGITVMGVLALRLLRRDGDIAGFLGTLRAIGPWLFAPLPLILVAAGVALVDDSGAWSADQTWVQIGIGLFVAVFLIGAAHQSRTAIAAGRAAERGDAAEARRQLRRWAWGMGAIVALLIAAYWDMVFKPGL
jgi:uncharacterized membrane protein